jgi:tRNA nucleotidyltransferase (CCA-adding enzyme)
MSDLKEIINFLKPHTKRAYLVGGALRDILMHKTPTDFDIEIYDITPKKFEILMNKLGAKGVGKSFFVYKYKNFDLSLPRTENKIDKGHKGFEVKICQNEKEASKRRDFTINSIMLNIFTNEILDFYSCLLYTSPSPRDGLLSRMPSSA